MAKTLTIWRVDTETALRMRLLAVGRGVSMASLLAGMVNREWERDETTVTPKVRRRARHLVRRHLEKV